LLGNGHYHGTGLSADVGIALVRVLVFSKDRRRVGRLLVIPWAAISVWRYPYVLDQDWPETNPNPEGSAAFFAVFEAAGILVLAMGLGAPLFRAARSAFRNPPPAA
jgi:hypothetical protein